jgi:hypothetical protein
MREEAGVLTSVQLAIAKDDEGGRRLVRRRCSIA